MISRRAPAPTFREPLFRSLGIGLGLRPDHYPEVLAGNFNVSWFEVISENFMTSRLGTGGRPIQVLEQVRSKVPVALHGVSLSIGSADPLDQDYLARLKDLVDRIQPEIVSDHLCWTGVNQHNLFDLYPLPFTPAIADYVAERILRVQDFLKRRILIENVSSYLEFSVSEMAEWEFLARVAEQADCGLLLDVNNVYVNSVNHGRSALEFLDGLPRHRVGQIHLAGHSVKQLPGGKRFLIDTHDQEVCPAVWDLYREAVARFGAVPSMIERDDKIPDYDTLEREALRMLAVQDEIRSQNRSGSILPPLTTVTR